MIWVNGLPLQKGKKNMPKDSGYKFIGRFRTSTGKITYDSLRLSIVEQLKDFGIDYCSAVHDTMLEFVQDGDGVFINVYLIL